MKQAKLIISIFASMLIASSCSCGSNAKKAGCCGDTECAGTCGVEEVCANAPECKGCDSTSTCDTVLIAE